METPTRSRPRRCGAGYAPIRDYAIIGDGRTAALVARDGSIDWLCLPDLDSPSVFAAILDHERGGGFALAPEGPADVERRYLPDTNVLETTWFTGDGVVRVTDALTIPGAERQLVPFREIARRIEGLSGQVAMRWTVTPRFGFGTRPTEIGWRAGTAVATSRADAIAVRAWEAGEPQCDARTIQGRFTIAAGARSLLALTAAHQEPMVFPARQEIEDRLDRTIRFWREWACAGQYDGPWTEAVRRSELALKLLVYAPAGAIAAAPTTSLPEAPGGERNWDYRFCWIRDASFTLDAMLRLGRTDEARAFFWWFMQATRLTRPRLQVLYQLDGGAHAPERELPLQGYCGSRPVRAGNLAAEQLQLDIYGVLLQAAWLYGTAGQDIDRDTGRELAEVANLVARIWREPDSGIWEVRSARQHFTESKVMCWVALDRAIRLCDAGILRGAHAHVHDWRREADAIRQFIETECWSDRMQSYARFAGSDDEVDASLLLMAMMSYHQMGEPRLMRTIAAVRSQLAHGPFLWRYAGEDGLSGSEGAFVTCSFWLVEALARTGQHDEAARLMEDLLAQANDVGLYAEEILPSSGAFLGNFPQGLVHLALISAAVAFAEHPDGMSLTAAIAGAFVGTLVLSTGLRGASELGLTRMDLPFLLGTAFAHTRTRAKIVGYALHFLAGVLFALLYYVMFLAIGRAGWVIGGLFGLVHAMFSGTVLVNVLLPAVHPRMGSPFSAADTAPLIEPPGFMLHNYGRATPLVTIAGHIIYGAIIGGFVHLAG